MRNVKQAHSFTNGSVLREDAAAVEFKRHQPTREVSEFGASRLMILMQRSVTSF
jgi:hypothetical protein